MRGLISRPPRTVRRLQACGIAVGLGILFISSGGVSSAASAGLVYLNALGQVIDTVPLVSAPLTTGSFVSLAQSVTIPAGVTQVRVKLIGFMPTDMATAGRVTFGAVGLYDKLRKC